MSTDAPLISIILSFRNEEDNLDELIRRLKLAFVDVPEDFELLFVNDDSNDRSLEILERHHSEDSRIKILNMSRRFGVYECMLAGMIASVGDAVIYLDSDLQDPPELIPQMLEQWRNGADIVHTTRTERQGENAIKMFITRLAYRTINAISHVDMPENTGDYKLLSRHIVDRLITMDEIEPYMRGLIHWIGFDQRYIYYKREPRFAGEGHFPLLRSLMPTKVFINGLLSFSVAPLYFALITGLVVSALALLYIVVILMTKLIGWNLPGWTAIMVAQLLLGGLNLFTVGVLGMYVGKIFKQIKNRPRFIVNTTKGLDGRMVHDARTPLPRNLDR
ncbi:glycosyl transferase, family 2 [Magnetococcus marinus MC-1]|uniref:Glycosyl transferase, family 2 n=1 Tax=Magnetococcus marinus (strain ATCC BAA-1437 / JCM 17883 / MC-1) TaxID=156889 RepID=A0L591_MAGMM|nr:glycosyltransferase family 2 protein [Magnetococcus marinus]ABK43134.1 glycosyl transferase, family 2 [Magnetococcus marinus MC-1]